MVRYLRYCPHPDFGFGCSVVRAPTGGSMSSHRGLFILDQAVQAAELRGGFDGAGQSASEVTSCRTKDAAGPSSTAGDWP
jgi:hypothetical protein